MLATPPYVDYSNIFVHLEPIEENSHILRASLLHTIITKCMMGKDAADVTQHPVNHVVNHALEGPNERCPLKHLKPLLFMPMAIVTSLTARAHSL